MLQRWQTLCLVSAVLFTGGWFGNGLAAPDADASAPHMQLSSQPVVGVVLYPDGETPVPDLTVHVWSVAKERFVYRTRTDHEGGFEIPWMREGRGYIFVGNVKIDLQIVPSDAGGAVQRHDVVVVVPRKMIVGSAGPRLIHVLSAPLLMTAPLLPSLVSP